MITDVMIGKAILIFIAYIFIGMPLTGFIYASIYRKITGFDPWWWDNGYFDYMRTGLWVSLIIIAIIIGVGLIIKGR